MNPRLVLLFTSMLQVSFVAMHTVFISRDRIIETLLASFAISIIWTLNVKKVAFGNWTDRLVYACGAMMGSGLGYLIANSITKI